MLSDNVKKLRDKSGLSQADFAKVCNLPRTTYRGIESGKIENPCLKQVCKICAATGITLNDLIPEDYYKIEVTEINEWH